MAAEKKRFEVTKVQSDDSIEPVAARRAIPSSIFDLAARSNEEPLNLEVFKKTYEKVVQNTSLALYDVEKSNVSHVIGATPQEEETKANMGTFFGVFLPCCQNIVGVIFFVRLPWIVGTAGLIEAAIIVSICNLMSVTTALSMSAIATNGKVTAGGTYFMISRSLGPAFGGSVGFLFFMGTSISVAMYYIGTVETFLKYISPDAAIFHKSGHQIQNDYRLYGSCLLVVMATIVFIGVTCVSRFALFAIMFLVAALVSVFVGLFMATPETSLKICIMGDRAVRYSIAHANDKWECNKDEDGPLYNAYCTASNDTDGVICDPYFLNNDVHLTPAVSGFDIETLKASLQSSYSGKYQIPGSHEQAITDRDITNDIATSFFILIAIYFPSITGVESGSNYSGDLRDAQISIPYGTISAVVVTSTIYLSSVLLFSSCVQGVLLRDKYGQSISDSGELVLSLMAWPTKWVVLVGTMTATIGAGLQALTGGPRLLQAIAEDNIIPKLRFFAHKTRGEPVRCLCFTFIIAEIGIIIAFLDYVAPIVTMFFLMCYGFINFAVTLQSLLDTPHWRPSFVYYHWSLTLFGTALCLTVMFICSWTYALVAIFVATCLYHYISYIGAEKEWGDGITGLSMTVALYALSRIKKELHHIKNWRPQVLVLLKVNMANMEEDTFDRHDKDLVQFAHWLKEGKGLVMFGTCLKGNLEDHAAIKKQFTQYYRRCLERQSVHGFIEVVVNSDVVEGLCCMIQSAGLGALRPNTVLLGWPYDWIDKMSERSFLVFLATMRNCGLHGNAAVIVKADNPLPLEKSPRVSGFIDIWWIINDGGMLLLLAHLLRRSKMWSKCQIRLFSVAHEFDNTIQIKKDLQTYLYQLRIGGIVEVVEMAAGDMSAYVYEQTLKLQERAKIINSMKGSKIGWANRKKFGEWDVNEVYEKARSSQIDVTGRASRPSVGTSIDRVLSRPQIEQDIRQVDTAVRMNAVMKARSEKSQLVIVNLPSVPASLKGQERYMTFLEILVAGLPRVLLVRGTGKEVITVYN